MKSNCNIAVITHKYPPIYSGYGNQLKEVIKNIQISNDKIVFYILTLDSPARKEVDFCLNERVVGVSSSYKSKIIEHVSFIFNTLFWLVWNKNKYDFIHCIGAHGITIFPGIIASKILRKKIIVKVTQSEFSPLISHKNPIMRFVTNFRIKVSLQANYYIAISEEIRYQLISYNLDNQKIIEIPNGVDTQRFSYYHKLWKGAIRQKLGFKSSDLLFLFVGSLIERKGIYDLFRAFTQLAKSYPTAKLVLCGPDYHSFYESIVKPSIFEESIIYVGNTKNINEYYIASDIFVLPSYAEGLANVLLEATASGNAVIVSDIQSNKSVITSNQIGEVFEVGNVESLKEKMEKYLNNFDQIEEIGRNAFEHINARYSISLVSKKYVDLYCHILKKSDE